MQERKTTSTTTAEPGEFASSNERTNERTAEVVIFWTKMAQIEAASSNMAVARQTGTMFAVRAAANGVPVFTPGLLTGSSECR